MPLIVLPSTAIHYLERGQSTSLILLHANPDDSRDFDAMIAALSKSYRVLAIDWPGYGESPNGIVHGLG